MEQRRGSEESLTSATESELVAKVNKLSNVLLGTNSNVTILNQRLSEYQRSHEIALEEIRRSVAVGRNSKRSGTSSPDDRNLPFSESTPHLNRLLNTSNTAGQCCNNGATCSKDNGGSPIVTLVSLLGEKDSSLMSLHNEVSVLRSELDRVKADLRREIGDHAKDKENADNFKSMVHLHLKKNIAMVNRLIEQSANLPVSVKRALLSHTPQEDFIVQQAELSSKLEWLAGRSSEGDPHQPRRR